MKEMLDKVLPFVPEYRYNPWRN
jgi:PadR family transcriptional regulator PadR